MISILGCGWLGLPLGAALVKEGYTVKGSTTTAEKLGRLSAVGIEPFLIQATPRLEGEQLTAFFEANTLIITIPPSRKQGDIIPFYNKIMDSVGFYLKNSPIQNVIYTSSTGVYKDINDTVTEASPLLPSRDSQKAALAAEQYLQKNTKVTILRLAGLIGGNRHPVKYLAGRTDLSNADAPVNLVHREDVVQVIQALLNQKKWGGIYNVCSDEHPTRKVYYTQQAIKKGLQPPTFSDAATTTWKKVSNEKVKQEFGVGFQPLT